MTTRTAAQSEASRRNGARSDGPATPEGKAASAQNARSHGLCAKFRIARHEDTPAFLKLLAGLCAAYRPSDVQEHELVRAIALASWQARRAQELDAQFWCWQSEVIAEDDFRHLRQIEANGRAGVCSLDTVMRYDARAETARARAMRDMADYRSKHLPKEESEPSPEPSPATSSSDRPIANTNEPETAPVSPGTNEPEPPPAPPTGGLAGPKHLDHARTNPGIAASGSSLVLPG